MVKFLLVVITLILCLSTITTSSQSLEEALISRAANCQKRCGRVAVPFPFGIGPGCSIDDNWFEIFCNKSTTPHTPFLRKLEVEVLNISTDGTLRITNPITSQNCTGTLSHTDKAANLTGSPFVYSERLNRFNAVSCGLFAYVESTLNDNFVHAGCTSICSVDYEKNQNMIMSTTNTDDIKNSCNGMDCCHTTIPSYTNAFRIDFTADDFMDDDDPTNDMIGKDECKYAFVVDQKWLHENSTQVFSRGVPNTTHVPVVVNWDLLLNSTHVQSLKRNLTRSDMLNSTVFCSTSYSRSTRYETKLVCECKGGYEGNPYLPHGCQDINECDRHPEVCSRRGEICQNLPGTFRCIKDTSNMSNTVPMIIGFCTGLGLLVIIAASLILYKMIMKRKDIKRREKYFKRNGGLLLKKQISQSNEVSMERTKLFSSKELEKATDHFNVDRVLGQGGQGTVFKGMLADGNIVAVKRSKIVDETKLTEFINEVLILSQINHRNVVKLFGCCLETDVPLLVYEFVPNGNLSQLIHDPNEEFPFTWEMRLRIATEVAEAVSYLHSAASFPIFHRDIKSTNILLDDKYRAKIADFGTSKSVNVDQTHVTTAVQGTFGYLDPEYYRSSQYTDKSDVYSFGVVLVELLTGQKAVSITASRKGRSLVSYFIDALEEGHLFEILDNEVMKGPKEEIVAVANLARRCLAMNGRERPTMKEVAIMLERTQMLENDSHSVESIEASSSISLGYST